MTKHFFQTVSFAAVSACFAAPVFADVTADEVWQNWKEVGASYGQTYTAGSESRAGDTLTISDLAIDMSSGRQQVKGTIPQVAFRETGDGRVEVTMSDTYQVNMASKDGPGKDTASTLVITQNALVVTASGTPDAIGYDVVANTVGIKVLDFMVDGKPSDVNFDMTLSKILANYQVTPGDVTGVNSTFAAGEIAFNARGENPEKGEKFDVVGKMTGIAGASSGAVPKALAAGDMGAMLAQGFTTDGSFTYDAGGFTLAITDKEGSITNIESASKGGNLNVSMDKDRIAYGVIGKGVALKASGSAIPFPELSAAYDNAEFSLLMPIAKSDDPKDFALHVNLSGLTVSDMLWNMIDPGATLPRDPATLDIALRGKAKPLVDMLSTDEMAMMGEKSPLEVSALDIDALQLTVAGAEFTGNGALAFDNTKSPLLGGVAPMPTGKVNLSLTGANTLLGKLQVLGLVDPQITMTFGMMAGMLAKPGPTPDSFIAEVEIKEDGTILSNGNPLPF
ncbi:DUF2125 domain-containing protein [Pseudorhodobacter ferrugineus]|uniref:DUF2125 domain-containing protein n=1 Tax=Pseudorhodobacter ferrugineus TaxID=77008 RepID=UPI0003B76716|nr:DUF2125 domain-containing protein [Pseudorhodobacter ferrugineus]